MPVFLLWFMIYLKINSRISFRNIIEELSDA